MKRPAASFEGGANSKAQLRSMTPQQRRDREAGIYRGGSLQQAAKTAKAEKSEKQQSGLAQYLVSKGMWQPVSLGGRCLSLE